MKGGRPSEQWLYLLQMWTSGGLHSFSSLLQPLFILSQYVRTVSVLSTCFCLFSLTWGTFECFLQHMEVLLCPLSSPQTHPLKMLYYFYFLTYNINDSAELLCLISLKASQALSFLGEYFETVFSYRILNTCLKCVWYFYSENVHFDLYKCAVYCKYYNIIDCSTEYFVLFWVISVLPSETYLSMEWRFCT